LDDADRTTLRNAAEALFWEMPPIAREERGKSKRVLQSTATQLARRMKSTKDLQGAMRELFCRRRKFMSDDRKPLHNADIRATIWKEWCEDFIRDELNDEQRQYKHSRQRTIFLTYMRNRYGCKPFFFALLQTGLVWNGGAAEHFDAEDKLKATQQFLKWIRDLIGSIKFHREHENTQLSRRKSGNTYGCNGLTNDELESRRLLDQARRNLEETQQLEAQLHASKGKGKGKSKAKCSRSFWDMSQSERWWLEHLWNNQLHNQLEEAKKRHGGRVQAEFQ
jgi:hypothetical protein